MIRLDPLTRSYAGMQIHHYHHAFSRPTADRAYVKLLKFIDDYGYASTKKIFSSKTLPSIMNLPILEAARFIDHYRDGRRTYWHITDKGRKLIASV